MKLFAAKQFTKLWLEDGTKHRLIVRSELHQLGMNPEAHFSITGEHDYQAKNNRWVSISCGAIHETIAKQMPQLQPLLLVHLADSNGVPMHAFENAGYWAGQTKYQQLDLVTLAKHLRVDQQEAFEMLEYIDLYWGELDSITTPAMAWKDACEHFFYPIRWQQQADAAKAMLNQIEQLQEAQ